MWVIESKIDRPAIPDHLEKVTVLLDWEARRKSRQKMTTRTGIEIALALPTGTVLTDGDVLFVGDSYYVVVEADKEDLIAVYPKTLDESARIGFELGNRHLAVSIQEGVIFTPYDPGAEGVVKTLGIPWERKREVFEPVRLSGHHVHA
jgi:urease accessory protein